MGNDTLRDAYCTTKGCAAVCASRLAAMLGIVWKIVGERHRDGFTGSDVTTFAGNTLKSPVPDPGTMDQALCAPPLS